MSLQRVTFAIKMNFKNLELCLLAKEHSLFQKVKIMELFLKPFLMGRSLFPNCLLFWIAPEPSSSDQFSIFQNLASLAHCCSGIFNLKNCDCIIPRQ